MCLARILKNTYSSYGLGSNPFLRTVLQIKGPAPATTMIEQIPRIAHKVKRTRKISPCSFRQSGGVGWRASNQSCKELSHGSGYGHALGQSSSSIPDGPIRCCAQPKYRRPRTPTIVMTIEIGFILIPIHKLLNLYGFRINFRISSVLRRITSAFVAYGGVGASEDKYLVNRISQSEVNVPHNPPIRQINS